MLKKYIIEFLSDWIRDGELRKRALHREVDSLEAWGLDAQQSADLRSLDKNRILGRMVGELEGELGIDLDKILQDWADTGGPGGGGGSAGAVYDQGKTHVRGATPAKLANGVESIVIVRGHGWDESLRVFFVDPNGNEVEGEILGVDCDIDVYQRATVKVTLGAPGSWKVQGDVTSNEPTRSAENVTIVVP